MALHPEDYCIGENELYYSRMASKGWRLEKRGRYLRRFSRSDPVEELYRVEVDYRELPEEQTALFDECGWEFVTKYGYLYAPGREDMTELLIRALAAIGGRETAEINITAATADIVP